jgi:hypothetical protein
MDAEHFQLGCFCGDACSQWKEFTSPDGRKYYYNKATKV